ncbi:hypothetical protein ALI144C_10055 [Actinosynnema sp. ALI-1.44]|uniref:RIP homotypic interaction motif-containing protein n=1 Tax=Actinosynnema sp. ALI-1.44 TaxID=1933779 RepID=UPI00097C22D9|nr:RIP homotypic interaction motif-containing protein [Actinosynnema sp. ALI-1.44]ONI86977.1 hypothetical protein ALI144C_10055 [Actinosynnema sp. ALI-1.44]
MLADSAELVVAALGAGAAAGVSDTASTAVKDAYSGLKSLTRKALRRDGRDGERLLADPTAHRDELVAALTTVDAEPDVDLVAAAKTVLHLTGHIDQRGKYVVDVHDNKGVQVGDGNTMTVSLDD